MPAPREPLNVEPDLPGAIAEARAKYIELSRIITEMSAVVSPEFAAPYRAELEKVRIALEKMQAATGRPTT